jgi:hypothetical protein
MGEGRWTFPDFIMLKLQQDVNPGSARFDFVFRNNNCAFSLIGTKLITFHILIFTE